MQVQTILNSANFSKGSGGNYKFWNGKKILFPWKDCGERHFFLLEDHKKDEIFVKGLCGKN